MKIKTSELIGAADLTDTVCKALRRAWQLGQTYWQQADSESFAQHKKAETTHAAFVALLDDTRAALAAAELRRQYAEIETLRTGYEAARLEIKSLKTQLHAAKQINTAQFWLITSSIPGSALRASHWQAPAGTQMEPIAEVVEELENDGNGWCAKVRWLYNPVPVGEQLYWPQPVPAAQEDK